MMAIRNPSFFTLVAEAVTKKDSMYSIIPLKIKRNGKNILNPSLIGNILLVKVNNTVVKITLLDTITTISVQLVINMSIATFTARRIPPIDKLSDFIMFIIYNYCCVGGTGGVGIGGGVINNPANSGTCAAGTQLGIPCAQTRVSRVTEPCITYCCIICTV